MASLGISSGGLAAWSAIMWYKGKGPRERKRVKKVAVEEEHKETFAEQLA